MDTTKQAGRPAKWEAAMTAAQRAAQYRRQRYEAASVAHEHLDTESTAVLLAGLARQLAAIGQGGESADVARELAANIIRALRDRHKIAA